jgi:hypothetical protein
VQHVLLLVTSFSARPCAFKRNGVRSKHGAWLIVHLLLQKDVQMHADIS